MSLPLAASPFAFAPLLLALLLDAAIGDPAWLYCRFPHPAALIGRAVALLDRALNRETATEPARRALGIVAIALLAGAAVLLGLAVHCLLARLPYGWCLEAIAMSMLLAQRSLHLHVCAVAEGLERGGIEAGRAAVRHRSEERRVGKECRL